MNLYFFHPLLVVTKRKVYISVVFLSLNMTSFYSDPKVKARIDKIVSDLQLDTASRAYGRIFDSVEQLDRWKIRQGYICSPHDPKGYVRVPHPRFDGRIKFPRFEYELLQKIGEQTLDGENVREAVRNYTFFNIGMRSPGAYESRASLDDGVQWHVVQIDLNGKAPSEVLEFPRLSEVVAYSIPEDDPVLKELRAIDVDVDCQ
jgi:hypothetical protein